MDKHDEPRRNFCIHRAVVHGVVLLATCQGMSCAPSPLSDDWIAPRELAAHSPTWRPPILVTERDEDTTKLPRPDDALGTLSLRQAITLSLRYSPDLASDAWDVRAAEARTLQAGLSPNPRVGYAVENFGEPDGGDLFLRQTIRISQVIELANKRQERVRLAAADQRLAAWDYENRRLGVITRVGHRYIAVLAAQQRLTLAQRTVQLTRHVYDIVDERVRTGVVPPTQRDRAAVRVSVERIALNRAEHRLHAERQALVSLWGGERPTFDRVSGQLDQQVTIPDTDNLVALAQHHPRLARWDDEIEQRRRAIESARANGVQDITAGAGLRHFPDADEIAGVAELSVPLPWTDRNQGRVLEARYNLAKAHTQRRATEAAMREELTAARADLSAARFAVTTLQEQTQPAAKAALQAAQAAFQNGKINFLDVLDAERTLVDVERTLIDARESFHLALVTIQGLTGAPLMDY